ncbi:diacylglycerol kinase family protein [Telmatospirillum sp. J64-1]|uniref:diacylglycerol/lipid kinase family protein n=1 Tax=Telmatospirillum sp. J64-1 TaxID=2502183 RepID=UPI00115DC230|nr:diacylglycerol kinase family protein [Telmatospirillum sp. J64-1]
MQVTVIHNPTAGNGEMSVEKLSEMMEAYGYRFRIHSSKEADLPAILAEPADLVAVAGGDGTVGKVLRTLPDRSRPVAVLPMGTANNIARSLGIEGQPQDLLRSWSEGRTKRFDIGVAVGPWGRRRFIEAIGVGTVAQAMAQADATDLPQEGEINHARRIICDVIRQAKAGCPIVTVDEWTLPEDLLFVEVMNINHLGPNLPVAPFADSGDGLLDIAYVREHQREEFLAWLDDQKARTPPPFQLERGKRIGMTWSGEPLRVDDEFMAPPEGGGAIIIELEEEPLRIVISSDSGHSQQSGG